MAKVWSTIDNRADMHFNGDQGRHIDVCCQPSTLVERALVTLAVSTFQPGLYNGGRSGLVYGFISAWTGTSLPALVAGEMASMHVMQGDGSCTLILLN